MTLKNYDRILAISDIHGKASQLRQLLHLTQYDPSHDQLILCGDLTDRGDENIAALATAQALKKNGAIILKGNHEQFLENSLLEMLENPHWMDAPSGELCVWSACNGGDKTLEELKCLTATHLATLLLFIQSLPAHAALEHYIFCHAGVDPQKPLAQQQENDFIWASRDFYAKAAYPGEVVVFGHTPTICLPNAPKEIAASRIWYDTIHGDKIGIDCGAAYGGRLACLELPSLREFYA